MYRRLLELLRLIKPRQPHLPQTNVSGSQLSQFEKEYVYSYTDAIAFMGEMQHETEYEVLDLLTNKWVKQKYTFLIDHNEQEETQKMIHNFRMGWCRLCNCR
jgi:hypothetical protein